MSLWHLLALWWEKKHSNGNSMFGELWTGGWLSIAKSFCARVSVLWVLKGPKWLEHMANPTECLQYVIPCPRCHKNHDWKLLLMNPGYILNIYIYIYICICTYPISICTHRRLYTMYICIYIQNFNIFLYIYIIFLHYLKKDQVEETILPRFSRFPQPLKWPSRHHLGPQTGPGAVKKCLLRPGRMDWMIIGWLMDD